MITAGACNPNCDLLTQRLAVAGVNGGKRAARSMRRDRRRLLCRPPASRLLVRPVRAVARALPVGGDST